MKKNVASQSIGAEMITAADGTIFTGAVSVLVTINNGTQTAGGGTAPAHEGNGYHSYTPTQAETNGDHLAFTFIGTGAISATIQVYTTFPQTVDNNVLAAGATGFAAIDTVVDAILVDTGTSIPLGIAVLDAKIDDVPTVAEFNSRTLLAANYFDFTTDSVTVGTNSDKTGYSLTQAFPTNFADMAITVTTGQVTAGNMRGTDSALLAASYTAPDNASITSILADTNELQLNQGNWLTATGFSTLVATDIVTGGAITTSGGNASVDVAKINGTVVIGAGTSGNLWRA
jgi:hypothetical protein